MKRTLYVCFLFLFLLSVIGSFLSVNANSLGFGWLSGWEYRKCHVLTGSTAGDMTDYQVEIVVYYDSGGDGSNGVHCNEKCKTDFGDIRFTKSDGETLIDYFMLEKFDGENATFWVEVDNIAASPSTTTIYMYYGKSDATTTSNGENTFPWLFDDLADYDIGDTPNMDDWETTGIDENNTITVQQDPVDASKRCIEIVVDGTVSTKIIALLKDYRLNFALHFRIRTDTDYMWYFNTMEDSVFITYSRRGTNDIFIWSSASAWEEFVPRMYGPIDTWMEVIHKQTNSSYMHWLKDGIDYTGGIWNTPTEGVNKCHIYPYVGTSQNLYIGGVGEDNRYIFARNFVYPEPSFENWGYEQWKVLGTDIQLWCSTGNNITSVSLAYVSPVRSTLSITISATGTSTLQVYCGTKGEPTTVTGASSWSYDDATKILTFHVSHSSPEEVAVIWAATITGIFTNLYTAMSIASLTGIVLVAATIIMMFRGGFSLDALVSLVVALIMVAIGVSVTILILANLQTAIG